MTTWSTTEYLNSSGYTPSTHASWSQYTIVLIAGDTLNVRTIYNGGDANATSINYITSPNSSSTVNDPDPTTSQTGLDKTWSSSSFSNSNPHTRWFWYTSGTIAQKSVRILTIPTTFGWNSVQSSIEQGSSASATLYVPSSFVPYIQGTVSESGDPQLSTNGSYEERFHWRITSSSTSNTVASGFSTSSGYFSGPSNNASITISPTTSASAGTYYLKLYYYSPTGTTAGNSTLIDTISFSVTALAPLDTSISLSSSRVVVGNTSSSYTQGLTGGGSNTIYYILNSNNLANGSNIDALRTGGDSRYVARTYTSTSSRSFRTAASGSNIITANLPSTGTTDTYYLYAANGTGTNSTLLSNTYTVDRPDVSISLTPSTTSLTASDTSNVTVNVTGDTSGTQYRLYSNDLYGGRWVSTYNGGGSSTTDFTISYDENPDGSPGTGATELPTAGNSVTYFSQARVPYGGGSVGWINTNDSFSISRSAASPTYSVTAPASIDEGSAGTMNVTTTNVANSTVLYWTVEPTSDFSVSSGNFSISNNSGSFTVTPGADQATENSETGTIRIRTGSTSGTVVASDTFTINDTSTGGSTSGGSGSLTQGSGAYGLKIYGPNGSSSVFDPSHRTFNLITGGRATLSAGSTTTVSNIANAQDATKVSVSLYNETFVGASVISYSRPTSTSIRFSNSSSNATVTFRYQIFRIG